MTTLRSQAALISSSDVVPASCPRNATDSSGVLIVNEYDRWSDAIDTLLDWRDAPHIDSDCLVSAIDFAVDQRGAEVAAPASILATEDSEITFEWRSKTLALTATIVAPGLVEFTVMQNCHVVDEGLFGFRRNPQTGKLEFEVA